MIAALVKFGDNILLPAPVYSQQENQAQTQTIQTYKVIIEIPTDWHWVPDTNRFDMIYFTIGEDSSGLRIMDFDSSFDS